MNGRVDFGESRATAASEADFVRLALTLRSFLVPIHSVLRQGAPRLATTSSFLHLPSPRSGSPPC